MLDHFQFNTHSEIYSRRFASIYRSLRTIYDPSDALAQEPDIEEKVLRNARLAHALNFRWAQVAGRKWSVAPAEEGEPEEAVLAKIVLQGMGKIRRFTNARKMLARADFSGARFAEVRKEVIWAPFGDGKMRRWVVPVMLKDIPKERFRWQRTEGTKTSVHLEVFDLQNDAWTKVPKSAPLIRHVYDDSEETLGYGRGLREALYFCWYAISHIHRERIDAVERFGQGRLVLKLAGEKDASIGSSNATIRDRALATLAKMKSRHEFVIGQGDELVQLDGSMTGHEMMSALTKEIEDSAVQLILGSVLPTGGGADVGSNARAQVEQESTDVLIQTCGDMLEESVSDGIAGPFLTDNYANLREMGLDGVPAPKFTILRGGHGDPLQNAQRIQIAMATGLKVKRSEAYDLVELTEPGEDDDVLEPPQQPGMPPGGGMLGAPGEDPNAPPGGDPNDPQAGGDEQQQGDPEGGGDSQPLPGADDEIPEPDAISLAEWREADHPRGQPGNAGEFGPGGGSATKGKARSSPAGATTSAGAPNVGDRVTHPTLGSGEVVKVGRSLVHIKYENGATIPRPLKSTGSTVSNPTSRHTAPGSGGAPAPDADAYAAPGPALDAAWYYKQPRDVQIAVQVYTGDAENTVAPAMNRALIAGRGEADPETGASASLMLARARRVNAAAEAHPAWPEPHVLYRGIGRSGDFVTRARASIGKTLRLPGMQSTSEDRTKALEFAKNGGALLAITSRNGLPIQNLSVHVDEREVVLGHDWKYRVTKVDDGKTPVIHMEVVEPHGGSHALAEWDESKHHRGQPGNAGVTAMAEWREDLHPRDDHGRFVSKDDIDAARSDPAKAAELRARVTDPEQRALLDEHLGMNAVPASPAAPRPKHLTDARLPDVGVTIHRRWRGTEYEIQVTQHGFFLSQGPEGVAGKTFPSLTAAARAITGAKAINGVVWFGLGKKRVEGATTGGGESQPQPEPEQPKEQPRAPGDDASPGVDDAAMRDAGWVQDGGAYYGPHGVVLWGPKAQETLGVLLKHKDALTSVVGATAAIRALNSEFRPGHGVGPDDAIGAGRAAVLALATVRAQGAEAWVDFRVGNPTGPKDSARNGYFSSDYPDRVNLVAGRYARKTPKITQLYDEKRGPRPWTWGKGDPASTLVHEIGHLLHHKNARGSFVAQFQATTDKYGGGTFAWAARKPERLAALKRGWREGFISKYGSANPHEFVAELFSRKAKMGHVPEYLMDVYRALGGAELPGWKKGE